MERGLRHRLQEVKDVVGVDGGLQVGKHLGGVGAEGLDESAVLVFGADERLPLVPSK